MLATPPLTRTPTPAGAPPQTVAHPFAIDRERFLEQGFVVLRGLITDDELASLRQEAEVAVERDRALHPEMWSSWAQPRLHLTTPGLVDARDAGLAQWWCSERVMGVAQQLVSLPDPGVTEMMMMCNPRVDHGPSNWHRDVHPHDMAPLAILQDALRESGPTYVQWNAPLYDDAVLWVVPGSHLRVNTQEENRHLLADPHQPLPGGIPVELRAGDAVVYINYLLHWGSNYSARQRRTLHGGHAAFTRQDPHAPYLPHVDARCRAQFFRWSLRSQRLRSLAELALRCAIHRDARGYQAALDAYHPGIGDAGRLALSCFLSKAAWHVRMVQGKHIPLSAQEEALVAQARPLHITWGMAPTDGFSDTEAVALWDRFRWLDAQLRAPLEQFTPGYQAGPMPYRFEHPAGRLTFPDVLAAWN